MKSKKNTGLVRIWKAFLYSADGLKAAIKNEAAFRQELIIGCILMPLIFLLPLSLFFKAYLIACGFIVLLAELTNSAIEAVVDMVCEEYHYLAKRAKDMGSAAVLIAIINLLISWGIALFKLWKQFKR